MTIPPCTIIINNLIVMARIGIYDAEKTSPQRIRVHCSMALTGNARRGVDQISDTVCYGTVRQNMIGYLQSGHIQLLETAAEKLAAIALADARVASTTIRIEKLDVFDDCESVGVELTRARP